MTDDPMIFKPKAKRGATPRREMPAISHHHVIAVALLSGYLAEEVRRTGEKLVAAEAERAEQIYDDLLFFGVERALHYTEDEGLPYGIRIAPGGRVWVALLGTNALAGIDPETLEPTLIVLPREEARLRRPRRRRRGSCPT